LSDPSVDKPYPRWKTALQVLLVAVLGVGLFVGWQYYLVDEEVERIEMLIYQSSNDLYKLMGLSQDNDINKREREENQERFEKWREWIPEAVDADVFMKDLRAWSGQRDVKADLLEVKTATILMDNKDLDYSHSEDLVKIKLTGGATGLARLLEDRHEFKWIADWLGGQEGRVTLRDPDFYSSEIEPALGSGETDLVLRVYSLAPAVPFAPPVFECEALGPIKKARLFQGRIDEVVAEYNDQCEQIERLSGEIRDYGATEAWYQEYKRMRRLIIQIQPMLPMSAIGQPP